MLCFFNVKTTENNQMIFYVWLTVHLKLYLCNKSTQCTIFSLHYITIPLHVSSPIVANHQEAEVLSHPGQQVPFTTLYTWPPDGGLQMGLRHVEAW
jgi:hypothetical protein